MTEQTNRTVKIGWNKVFFDATCGFCTHWANRIRPLLASRKVEVIPFEDGGNEPEMVFETREGERIGGGDAVIRLLKCFPITIGLAWLLGLPLFRPLVNRFYKAVAVQRHCGNRGQCALVIEETKPTTGWLALSNLVLGALAIGLVFDLAGWVWMWMLAFAMWVGFKQMVFRTAGGWVKVHPAFFIWPGMDTDSFLYQGRPKTQKIPWGVAIGFVVVGLLLLIAIPYLEGTVVTGWVGFAAMVCLLHFGSFLGLAGFYNYLGFAAKPIMREPWKARGLGDFWSNRWNRGYSDWARECLFKPLTEKFGPEWGTLVGFLASGVAHELVISVPACTGYGLPTLYFLLQSVGLIIEKKARLRQRRFGRVWLWLFVIGPAPLLFFTAFFENVFNPMLLLIR